MTSGGSSRAVSHLVDGRVVASIDIAAPPERVFRALCSPEIVDWWVNPGAFDTREWRGDVRVGGRWRASGMSQGGPYTLEGEFLDVDPPRKLIHTWHPAGSPQTSSTVTYLLESIAGGTHLAVYHTDIASPDKGRDIGAGWRTSFDRLAEILSARSG